MHSEMEWSNDFVLRMSVNRPKELTLKQNVITLLQHSIKILNLGKLINISR